jgi:transcriptional regulator with XRE-family HTH domain
VNLPEIGQAIRRARRVAKLSQQALAQRAEVSRYTLIKLERGQVDDVQFKTLAAILVELDLLLAVVPRSLTGLPVLGEKQR